MTKPFTYEQFKQLVTALTQFGTYEEWKDVFEDTIRCYTYTSEAMQLKCVHANDLDFRSINVEVPEGDGWNTETIIEEVSGDVAVYGKEYTFDALMDLFPKKAYNEREWLELL